MDPLSVWTFYRRHKRHAALILSLTMLVTGGLYLMGALVWGVFVEPARKSYMVLSRFSFVEPSPSAVTKLERILQIEQEQDYHDLAISGGLSNFADEWLAQAHDEGEDESWAAQIAQKIRAYSLLKTQSERRSSLEILRRALEDRHIVPGSTNEGNSDPAVITRIRSHPDVIRVVPAKFIRISLPGMLSSEDFAFEFLGLQEEDLPYILDKCGAILKEGNLPRSGRNELLLSEDVAKILNVHVGDDYNAVSSEFHEGVDDSSEATSFEVVGIVDSDVRLGIVSLEFLNNHKQYHNFPARFIVIATENGKSAVDTFLHNEIHTRRTEVMTLKMLNERIVNEALPGLAMLLPLVLIITIAFSLVVVIINWIANSRRLPEFGVLYATGYSKKWLIHHLTVETGMLSIVGWGLGMVLSWLVLYLLNLAVFSPRGHDFNYISWVPFIFALPVPIAVTAFTLFSVRKTLTRLDPVAVVEKGELSQEREQKRGKKLLRSLPKPLAAATYCKRHSGRIVLLLGGMCLIILAVGLIFFVLSVSADAQKPLMGYLRKVSIVRSTRGSQGLDQHTITRVMTYPAVERVIPVAPRYHMLGVNIPPFTGGDGSPFGVYAEDMTYLVSLYGLELKEGRLPNPYTNEMVIPEALAQNRGLNVGDVIGDPEFPAYPGAPSLETEFVISGIFARPNVPDEQNLWGFISLEFLEDNQPFPMPEFLPLIIVPKLGQKDILDDWLENELVNGDVAVVTYGQEITRIRNNLNRQMTGMALLESAIAIVAAISLAVLNYVFIAHRQKEFGLLHALGYSRKQLVWRTMRETLFTTGIAWGCSAILCFMGLMALYFGVFTRLGLRFNLFALTPWLSTVPIPVVVLIVNSGTAAWLLSRLDPITIIERRL